MTRKAATLFKSILTIGIYTLLSRFLGLLREVLMAFYLGASWITDAFIVAQRLPNMFRNLVSEGAFNAVFVPSFSDNLHKNGKVSAKKFAEQIQSIMLSGLFIFVILLQLLMPWLVHIIAPGYADTQEKATMVQDLSQITMPYLLFMFLTGLQSAVLASLNKFAAASVSPVILNICLIGVLYFLIPGSNQPGYVLAWTLFGAGAVQFLVTAFFCYKAGFPLAFIYPRNNETTRLFFKKMLPGLIGASVTQINLLVGTIIATWQDGAVSYLYFADRVYQLPLALLGTAAGTALLPMLSQALAQDDKHQAHQLQGQGIFVALLLGIPATVILMAVPYPIVNVLFERGQFTLIDAQQTSFVLQIMAMGLPAYLLVKSLLPIFYARHDTKTPFHFALICVAANMVLNIALFPWIGFIGIAIATVIASALNACLLYIAANKRGYLQLQRAIWIGFIKMLIGGLFMGVFLVLIPDLWSWPTTLIARVSYLVMVVLVASGIYFACLFLMGVISWKKLRRKSFS